MKTLAQMAKECDDLKAKASALTAENARLQAEVHKLRDSKDVLLSATNARLRTLVERAKQAMK